MINGHIKTKCTGIKTNKLGIIDSGAGGLTIAQAINAEYPGFDIHYFGDHNYLPYGNKTNKFLIQRINQLAKYLHNHNCDKIILACHTVSAALHQQHLNFNWQGVAQPTINQLKTIDKSANIGIIGTQATISSGIYQEFGSQLITPNLAQFIENNNVTAIKQNITEIAQHFGQLDYIVLACTHYPLARKYFLEIMPQTKIINTPKLTALSLDLERLNRTNKIIIESSKPNDNFIKLAEQILPNCTYLESVL